MTSTVTRFPILFVDDEEAQRRLIAGFFAKRGHAVSEAANGQAALESFEKAPVPVVCVDMKMPGMSGIELIGKLLEKEPGAQIIVLTAFGTVETAVAAMKAGAFHYQTKPVDLEELTVNIEKAFRQYQLRTEMNRSAEALRDATAPGKILGRSPAIEKLRQLIERVGPTESSALITGPSGSGKELVAQAIHSCSSRSGGRFVAVNCGAFPESILESELFGHEKGAFTGADRRRLGRLEQADGGTLFLDEIGEAPLSLQVKLLRALETRQIERLGSESSVSADFRLLTATNADLEARIASGQFREDLFYRLNVVQVVVPSLRERPEDIRLLAESFLSRFGARAGRENLTLTDQAHELLAHYNWPGNVRELQNFIERAVTLSDGAELGPELFTGIGTSAHTSDKLADVETAHIERLLRLNDWSIGATAEKLGIHRNTLTQKIKDYGLSQN